MKPYANIGISPVNTDRRNLRDSAGAGANRRPAVARRGGGCLSPGRRAHDPSLDSIPWGHYLPYDPDAPAVCISWDGAVGFVTALNRALGADLYRLPTEEEWEYACRAGTDTIWYFGDSDDELGEHAWVFANSAAAPHPVGQKRSNPWGLFDMYGNAREWCSNRPSEYVCNGFVGPARPWRGEFRAVRGGSRDSSSLFARSAARSASVPSMRYNILQGFRIVRNAIVQSGAREPVR